MRVLLTGWRGYVGSAALAAARYYLKTGTAGQIQSTQPTPSVVALLGPCSRR